MVVIIGISLIFRGRLLLRQVLQLHRQEHRLCPLLLCDGLGLGLGLEGLGLHPQVLQGRPEPCGELLPPRLAVLRRRRRAGGCSPGGCGGGRGGRGGGRGGRSVDVLLLEDCLVHAGEGGLEGEVEAEAGGGGEGHLGRKMKLVD